MTATVEAQSNPQFAAVRGHNYISLTTFRKNGTSVATPVWFAEADGRLYVLTGHNAGKIKRIRHTERVQIAPCNARGKLLGPVQAGRARILPANAAQRVERLITQKYGWQKRAFDLLEQGLEFVRNRRAQLERDYLEIEPVG